MIRNLSYVFILAAMFANGVYGAERSISPDPHPAKRTPQMQAKLGQCIEQNNGRILQERAVNEQAKIVRNMENALRELKNTLKRTDEYGNEEVEYTTLRDERIKDNYLVLALNDFARIIGVDNCITNETELAVAAIHRFGDYRDREIIKSDVEGDSRDLGNNWIAFEKILPENDRSGINGEAIRYYNKLSGLYITIQWNGNTIIELSVYNVDPTKAPDKIVIKRV